MNIVDAAKSILAKYPLCDHCLGRLFAARGYMMDNGERGRVLKDIIFMESIDTSTGNIDEQTIIALARSGHARSLEYLRRLGRHIEPEDCFICGGLFSKVNLDELANKVVETIKGLGIEFRSIQVGSIISKDIMERELKISTEFSLTSSESVKRELNRYIGRLVSRKLGVRFSKTNPDIVVTISPMDGRITVDIMPMYIESRYRRLIRGVGGQEDVRKAAEKAVSRIRPRDLILHIAGVESAKVRVLGSGRPMVIEAVKPFSRTLGNISEVTQGGVELTGFVEVSKSRVREVKGNAGLWRRIYRVLARGGGDLSTDALKSLEDYFKGRPVKQLFGRRWRVKTIYSLKANLVSGRVFELMIDTQGGFSIRRFITGDGTEPSISGTLGVRVEPMEIDLLEISSD